MFLLLFFKKILFFFKIIFKSKLEITKLEKIDILIWGKPGFINILKEKSFKYLNNKKIYYLDIWGEKYNLLIIIKCILNLRFTLLDYTNEYIKALKPSIILSFLDNYSTFYLIKKNKTQKKILIQNATRSNEKKTFNFKKADKLNDVDYLFCHNKNIKKIYQKVTRAEIFVIGSFISNNVNIEHDNKKFNILYISTFRFNKDDLIIDRKIKLSDYNNSEKKLIQYVAKYCSKHNIKLNILLTPKPYTEIEKKFFIDSLTKNNNWQFLRRRQNDYKFPYNMVDKAKVVIGIDSTLLYESFSRGIKTIFFDIRPHNKYLLKNRHFGWPKRFSSRGPFWTNKLDYKNIHNLILNVSKLNHKKWSLLHEKYKHELMNYDKKNKIFKRTLLKYLASQK